MLIKILGSGSAYGTPMCFNNWGDIVNKESPHNLRSRFSIYLEDDGHKMLIDMGPEFRLQTIENNITDIDGVFLTHGHYDHIAGVPELFRAAALLNKQLNIYASEETLQEVKNCYGYMFGSFHEAGKEKIVWNTISTGINRIEGMDWLCMEFPHHHLHSSGFRYKDMALITDYEEIPEKDIPLLQNLKLLIIECNNGLQQVQNGHSNWYLIKSYLERITPQKVILTHLSPKVDIEILGQELPENVELAYDGMVIEI